VQHSVFMPLRLALLFGAGASFDSGRVRPHPPPLGAKLFSALVDACPASWAELPSDLNEIFEEDFEIGMHELWSRADRTVQAALIDMGRYFCAFRPPEDGSSSYGTLVRTLRDSRLLPQTGIATLNYDCLIELSAEQQGVGVSYANLGRPPDNLLLWKPHGSCNFMSKIEIYGSGFVGTANYYEGPIEALHPDQVLDKFDRDYSLPPAMSLFAPGKPTPVAAQFVGETRAEWSDWARASKYIAVIGAAPYLADDHIWTPILEGGADVWYVGGDDRDFASFRLELGSRLTVLGRRFSDAVAPIARRLQILA
jgi:hypothetical protein